MKAVVSVIGKDKPGIIAKISACLYEFNANIEDINQTIMQDNFTMIMLIDLSKAKGGLDILAESLSKIGHSIGLAVRVQSIEIFQAMHKI
ncbi:MAG: ACT domain-containing protein [Elusimicrobiota bacterium]|jgi:ACT domain-containing protein|nr:ACT domain-containing protein [Elusimicrobiota bacterium]